MLDQSRLCASTVLTGSAHKVLEEVAEGKTAESRSWLEELDWLGQAAARKIKEEAWLLHTQDERKSLVVGCAEIRFVETSG